MSRPEVSLDNYEAVYDYYESHEQNQLFARFGHFALSQVYRPTISFAEEGFAEIAIAEEIEAGSRLVISPNHLTADDQYVIVAVAEKADVFHPLRGHTFIPTEPSLFTRPGFKGHLLRAAVDGLGAIPIVRLEDLRRQGVEITPEIEENYRKAMLRANEIEVTKIIDQGQHMAGFWEGTRNRVNHSVVQPLKKGIGHTACQAAEYVDVSIVPWGMYYGGEPKDYKKGDVPDKRKPHVHVGMPIKVKTTSADKLVDQVKPAMQECVDEAVVRSLNRK